VNLNIYGLTQYTTRSGAWLDQIEMTYLSLSSTPTTQPVPTTTPFIPMTTPYIPATTPAPTEDLSQYKIEIIGGVGDYPTGKEMVSDYGRLFTKLIFISSYSYHPDKIYGMVGLYEGDNEYNLGAYQDRYLGGELNLYDMSGYQTFVVNLSESNKFRILYKKMGMSQSMNYITDIRVGNNNFKNNTGTEVNIVASGIKTYYVQMNQPLNSKQNFVNRIILRYQEGFFVPAMAPIPTTPYYVPQYVEPVYSPPVYNYNPMPPMNYNPQPTMNYNPQPMINYPPMSDCKGKIPKNGKCDDCKILILNPSAEVQGKLDKDNVGKGSIETDCDQFGCKININLRDPNPPHVLKVENFASVNWKK
jgi:hypothetical protein